VLGRRTGAGRTDLAIAIATSCIRSGQPILQRGGSPPPPSATGIDSKDLTAKAM
jgi:hypothetical protein